MILAKYNISYTSLFNNQKYENEVIHRNTIFFTSVCIFLLLVIIFAFFGECWKYLTKNKTYRHRQSPAQLLMFSKNTAIPSQVN